MMSTPIPRRHFAGEEKRQPEREMVVPKEADPKEVADIMSKYLDRQSSIAAMSSGYRIFSNVIMFVVTLVVMLAAIPMINNITTGLMAFNPSNQSIQTLMGIVPLLIAVGILMMTLNFVIRW